MLDTETTGLGPDREPVEIAVIDECGSLVFESRVCPRRPSSPAASRIHGLTTEDLCGAPSFASVLPRLARILAGRRIYAYGARFDRTTLELACRHNGLALEEYRWQCILDRYQALRGFRPPLRTACEIEGIPLPPGPHRASTDAQLAWHLLQKLPALLEN